MAEEAEASCKAAATEEEEELAGWLVGLRQAIEKEESFTVASAALAGWAPESLLLWPESKRATA